jgi:hypothetical protein
MAVRKCSTCKHYEPAPIWRKGWCRNPLLYSPQQSHLVGEDDLDCDRGMGNYWEPIDQDPAGMHGTASYGHAENAGNSGSMYRESGEVAPVHLRGHHETGEQSERRGGDVSQYGGPGRPTGSDDYGSSGPGHGDDDRYTQPFSEQGGSDPYGGGGDGGERTPFGYQPEERYWTDYLRIAAPVVGVILMLGLVWFWVANMLGDDNGDDVATDDNDTSGPVIPSETEEPTPDETDEGDPPIEVATPEDENGEEEGENGEEDDAPTTIGPGATVVVVGTGEDGLNVRASASTEAEVVTSLPDGTSLTVTGESQEADDFTWWPVESEDATGFVVQEFIELSE